MKKIVKILNILIFLISYSLEANTLKTNTYTLQMCIARALQNNAEIKESAREIDIYSSKLDEAKAVFTPKVDILTFLAPTYEIKGDIYSYEKNYNKWGPYYHLGLQITMPIYTFGKVEAYKKAAENGILYAKNKKLEKEVEIVLDIKKYYYGYILADKLSKLVLEVKKTLADAIEQAEEIYSAGKGEVKKSDIERLKVYMAELKINEIKADKFVSLTRSALFFKMGIKETNRIVFKKIPLRPIRQKLKPLDFYIESSLKNRPEMKQIMAGLKAKKALVEAEKCSFYPDVFVAGQLNYNWASVIDDQDNPWLNDPYNGLDGGVALGVKYYFDYKTIKAKIKGAQADYDKLLEKYQFAKKAISLQVKKTYMETVELQKKIKFLKDEVKAASSWMRSAGLLYATGTGSAKDALEGLAAYAIARQKYYTAIYDYNVKLAELLNVAGIKD